MFSFKQYGGKCHPSFHRWKKNWLFADTPKGASASATVYSLIETVNTNGLNVFWYLNIYCCTCRIQTGRIILKNWMITMCTRTFSPLLPVCLIISKNNKIVAKQGFYCLKSLTLQHIFTLLNNSLIFLLKHAPLFLDHIPMEHYYFYQNLPFFVLHVL